MGIVCVATKAAQYDEPSPPSGVITTQKHATPRADSGIVTAKPMSPANDWLFAFLLRKLILSQGLTFHEEVVGES